jgi:hypothetical protein
MSGRLCIEATASKVLLRKRHYPILCALWSYGIMFALLWFIIRGSSVAVSVVATIIGLSLATFMVGAAVHLDRKPPLLEFDLVSLRLTIPRSGDQLEEPSDIRIGIREVVFETGEGTTIGEALYVAKGSEDPGSPVYVEHSRGQLRSRIERFVVLTHLPMFTLPRVSVT